MSSAQTAAIRGLLPGVSCGCLRKVSGGECSAANSVITHASTGRTLTFGAVAAAAAALAPPETVFLKEPETWRLLGTPGVDPLKVEMHNTRLGGGFGRRGTSQDFVVQAVRIAKAAGRPVKLMWSREEDMQHDFYRPASMARLKAAVDHEGRLTGMTVRISAPSMWSIPTPSPPRWRARSPMD